MTTDNQDKAFIEAYKQNKARYAVPSRIKRQIEAQASQSQGYSRFLPRKEWLAFAAAIFCIVVIQGLISFSDSPFKSSEIVAINIEYHGYDENFNAPAIYANHSEQLKLYAHEYASQLANIKARYSKSAQLIVNDRSWQFKKCDEQLIDVSIELIEDLSLHNKIPREILPGSFVELDFDKEGRLVAISPATNNQC